MGLKRILQYTLFPAAVGSALGFVAHRMGYDISGIEGMKETVLAGLPVAVLFTSSLTMPN